MYTVATCKDLLSYCISRMFHGRSARFMVEDGSPPDLGMVSTDLSNLVPSALGLINPVETFTSVYNLYLLYDSFSHQSHG